MEGQKTIRLADTIKPGEQAKALKITPRVNAELIKVAIGDASVSPAQGRGSRRILTVEDFLLCNMGKKLRGYGLTPRRVRAVCDYLRRKSSIAFSPMFTTWIERVSASDLHLPESQLRDRRGELKQNYPMAYAESTNTKRRYLILAERALPPNLLFKELPKYEVLEEPSRDNIRAFYGTILYQEDISHWIYDDLADMALVIPLHKAELESLRRLAAVMGETG